MSKTVDDFSRLLDLEHAALVAGDFAQLNTLLTRKTELIAGIEGHDVSGLETLRARAERNQKLLDAAMAGIRDVTARIGASRRLRSGFDTYDQTGERTVQRVAPPRVTHRA